MSMAPGSTYIPPASTTRAPAGCFVACPSNAVITPPETCTSTCRGPSAVPTVPPEMTRSVKLEISDPEQRGVRDACFPDVLLSPFAAVEHDHQMDHLDPRIAQHLRRPQRVASG